MLFSEASQLGLRGGTPLPHGFQEGIWLQEGICLQEGIWLKKTSGCKKACGSGVSPRGSRGSGIFWLLPILLFSLLLVFPWMGMAEEAVSVIMPSRLSLVPWTLGTVKKVLERGLGRAVSLSVRSETAFHWPDPSAADAWLLLEEGVPAPAGLHPTGLHVNLLWMLAVRSDLLAPIASACPTRLDGFFQVLNDFRGKSPDVFPWFESLYSPETLRCFTKAFGHSGQSATVQDALPTLRYFHKAMNGKLLNPLSIESDEGLAFDVFEAGDAVFSSMWLVEEAWEPGSILRGALASRTFFVPVPGLDGPAVVPRITFSLWARKQASVKNLMQPFGVGSFPFPVVPLVSRTESAWNRDVFPRVYDQLIQGGSD